MPFKQIEGHTSLFRAQVVSAEQFELAQKLIAANEGNPLIRNKDLHLLTQTVTGAKYCPYFIGKNDFLKVKSEKGLYDLSRLKASTKPVVEKKKPAKKTKKVTEPATETETPATVPAPKTKKPGKKSKGKKEAARTKKGSKKVAPVTEQLVPVTETVEMVVATEPATE